MAQFTDFGIKIKKRLLDIGQSEKWLIAQIHDRTGKYMDSGYLWKIMAGRAASPKIVQAIREILNLPGQPAGGDT